MQTDPLPHQNIILCCTLATLQWYYL